MLTDDETTILLIAEQGESMMPIGRWEAPVEALVARGFLVRKDKFNNVITPAGREALNQRNQDDDQAYVKILELGTRISNARMQAQQSVEQAAIHLSMAVKSSVLATGDTQDAILARWLPLVEQRARELLK